MKKLHGEDLNGWNVVVTRKDRSSSAGIVVAYRLGDDGFLRVRWRRDDGVTLRTVFSPDSWNCEKFPDGGVVLTRKGENFGIVGEPPAEAHLYTFRPS